MPGVSIIERKGTKHSNHDVLEKEHVYKALPTEIVLNILSFHYVFMDLVPIEGALLDMPTREFMGLFPDGRIISLCFNVLLRMNYSSFVWTSTNLPILLRQATRLTMTSQVILLPGFTEKLSTFFATRDRPIEMFAIQDTIKYPKLFNLKSDNFVRELLTHVDLQINEETPHNAFEMLSNFDQLEHISAEFVTNLDMDDWFLESLVSLTHVDEVCLKKGNFSFRAFSKFIKTAPFSKLSLDSVRVDGLREINFYGIEDNLRLRSLSLKECIWKETNHPFSSKTLCQLFVENPPRTRQTSLSDVRRSLETVVSPIYSLNFIRIIAHDVASVYRVLFLMKAVKTLQLHVKSFVSSGPITVLLEHVKVENLVIGNRMSLQRDTVFKLCEEKGTQLYISSQF